MDKRSTSIIVGITLIAAAFAVFVFVRGTLTEPQTDDVRGAVPADEQKEPLVILTAKHAFRDGMHTIVGEYDLPSPCHILDTRAVVSPDGKNVTVDFTVTAPSGEMCAQVITPTRYRVQFTAPENANISARVNGAPVILSLIEAGPNEDLENIELYIKG
jgi:hypothetical protein